MDSTKKSLLASGLALCASAALLMGSTFAWFTDSVTNTGNVITAGSLRIDATAYDVYDATVEGAQEGMSVTLDGRTATFEAAGQDLKTDSTPIIGDTLFEPGRSNLKLLTVANNGTLAAKVKLEFDVTDGGLMEALWFDFVQVGSDGTVTGELTERPMETLEALSAREIPLSAGESVSFVLIYGMDEEAGNEYQDKTFEADVTILATQYTEEADGFGDSTYDENAGYPVIATVTDADSLEEALQNPGVPVDITASEDISGVRKLPAITGDVTMNLGSSSIYYTTDVAATDATVTDGGSLTINADTDAMYGLRYNLGQLTADGEGSTLTVNGGKYGDSGYQNSQTSAVNGGTVIINDGSFSSSGAEGHAVTASAGGTVTINGGSVGSSGYQSVVLYADGGTIVVEDVDFAYVNGRRYGAANGGQILVSKAYSPAEPTSIAAGCAVTDAGDYWQIAEA